MNLKKCINTLFYLLKPIIPRRLQIDLRSKIILRKRGAYSSTWPILEKAGKPPVGWSGWPDQRQFALVLTHDVETAKGQEKCLNLKNLEEKLGFRSSFNFVPERYNVSAELRNYLSSEGFEVGVHGLRHDGKLFLSRKIFFNRSKQINRYIKEWKVDGFRAPSMRPNLDWIHDLNINYDASTFDTDPFDFQPDGVATIFPFWRPGNSDQHGYVELPTTLPQDFYLFLLMKEKNIDVWKRKLDWIAKNGGMALLNTHPDYMHFDEKKLSFDQYPIKFYKIFLEYIRDNYSDKYWHTLPKTVAEYFIKQKQKH